MSEYISDQIKFIVSLDASNDCENPHCQIYWHIFNVCEISIAFLSLLPNIGNLCILFYPDQCG